MTPRPRAQRYNAHGDRWCTGCDRYLRLDQFAPRPGRADPWYGRCRDCINAQYRRNYRKRVLRMSEAEWRAQVEAAMARQRRTRAQRAAERQSFVAEAIALVRRKGFTYDDLSALTGLSRMTMRRYERGEARRFVQTSTVETLQRLTRATAGVPEQPVRRGRGAKPHPHLALVRARLERMADLAALEAA